MDANAAAFCMVLMQSNPFDMPVTPEIFLDVA